jgi:hypothetical protein
MNNHMPTREQFLNHLWTHVIDASMPGEWIDNTIAGSARHPNSPFSEIGPLVKRLLDLGATREELSVLTRFAAYEAVFSTLYALDDPGVDDDDFLMLHESLLTADPSGRDGRPLRKA